MDALKFIFWLKLFCIVMLYRAVVWIFILMHKVLNMIISCV